MKRTARILAATGAGLALTVGAGLAGAPAASAAPTWVKTTATKVNGYSWNGYRATVNPTGFNLPSGHVKVSTTESVKKGTTYVARGVTSARLTPGTYKVYSTFKYRSRTRHTAYRSHSMASSQAESCTVTEANVTDISGISNVGTPDNPWWSGYQTVTYTGTCTWSDYDSDWNERSSTGTATWTESELVHAGFDATPAPQDPQHFVGEDVSYVDVPGRITWRTPYTTWRYGTTKVAYRYRTATVTKVVNTPVMTRTEWNAINYGDSLTRVRKIVGSKGTKGYDDGGSYLGTQMYWNNSSGGLSFVWFDGNGRATDISWY